MSGGSKVAEMAGDMRAGLKRPLKDAILYVKGGIFEGTAIRKVGSFDAMGAPAKASLRWGGDESFSGMQGCYLFR